MPESRRSGSEGGADHGPSLPPIKGRQYFGGAWTAVACCRHNPSKTAARHGVLIQSAFFKLPEIQFDVGSTLSGSTAQGEFDGPGLKGCDDFGRVGVFGQ